MSKTFLFRLIIGLSLLAAAIFWLLSVIDVFPEIEHGTVGQWACLVITLGIGTAFLLRGLFEKNSIPFIKKLWVFFGIAILTVGALIVVEIFAWGTPIMPIIAVALATAFLIALIAVGGKKWDIADNEKVNDLADNNRKTTWDRQQEKNQKK
ncbi:MAG: hypothetical protein FWE13_06300 [Firmicutes bacterium]|nr:hypothetical protein [Bacillota bacterium]